MKISTSKEKRKIPLVIYFIHRQYNGLKLYILVLIFSEKKKKENRTQHFGVNRVKYITYTCVLAVLILDVYTFQHVR